LQSNYGEHCGMKTNLINKAINNSYEFFKSKGFANKNTNLAPLIIVADNIQSPMNAGAILRLASNLNAEKTWLVYEKDPGFRSYKIKSTSSGASEKTDWEIIAPEKLNDVLPPDYEIIAIETTEAAQNIFEAKFPEKIVMMVGNERLGISEPVLKLAKQHLFIPVPGTISSLNVTHALAVGLYEWYRQSQ